jgi:hypothetical protein
MLQQIREPLGAVRRVPRQARRDRACDQEELSLDGGRHPAGSPLDHHIQPADRVLQAPHDDEPGVLAISILRERDDLSHWPIMSPASDTPGRFADLEGPITPREPSSRAPAVRGP